MAELEPVAFRRSLNNNHHYSVGRTLAKKTIVRRAPTFQRLTGIHPVVSRILANRNVQTLDDIDYGLHNLLPPDHLSGIEEAVALLGEALAADASILFVGDFDADGATSCALGVRAMRRFGASHVDYLVPNRFEFGYGLSPEIVGVAASRQPDLIVTVDNGISSHDGVMVARELGISVLITDHHLPGDGLPPADVIVNPNLVGDRFASKSLAGVGVIFYVMAALRQHLRDAGWFARAGRTEPNMADLLDLVAVGTVADVVPLDRNNRILVAQGLARINARRCCPGIAALLHVAGRDGRTVTAADLGFAVGPRLNAAGRLDDMAAGIECLLADDPQQARTLADCLHALNAERRELQADMEVQAGRIVDGLARDWPQLPAGLCLFQEDWHQGIVGLIAARMRERINRPVVAFAAVDEQQLKASARSVPGLHIRDLLSLVAARHPGLMTKFGGHAMAAGLSLERGRFDEFAAVFEQTVAEVMGEGGADNVILTDGTLADEYLSVVCAELLRQTSPWGQDFPEPLFDDEFEVLEQRVLADIHLKLRVRRVAGSRVLDALAFRYLDEHQGRLDSQRVRLVYRLEVNEYQGQRTPQLIIEHMEPC